MTLFCPAYCPQCHRHSSAASTEDWIPTRLRDKLLVHLHCTMCHKGYLTPGTGHQVVMDKWTLEIGHLDKQEISANLGSILNVTCVHWCQDCEDSHCSQTLRDILCCLLIRLKFLLTMIVIMASLLSLTSRPLTALTHLRPGMKS